MFLRQSAGLKIAKMQIMMSLLKVGFALKLKCARIYAYIGVCTALPLVHKPHKSPKKAVKVRLLVKLMPIKTSGCNREGPGRNQAGQQEVSRG